MAKTKGNNSQGSQGQERPYSKRLSREEQRSASERARPTAAVIHETIVREGEEELSRPPTQLAWSGMAAGLSMGFSLLAQGAIAAFLPSNLPGAEVVISLGYSVGFLVVILGRQQLFTENTITPILPLLESREHETMFRVVRLWAIVLATNLAGALAFAWILALTQVLPPGARDAMVDIGLSELQGGFGNVLMRGIFAGWLIALMVWMLPGAEAEQVAIIIIITTLIGLANLAHVIAGSVEVFYSGLLGSASWVTIVFEFIVPAFMGNVTGGVGLVAIFNHGQVTSGER
ncbi:MAG: formate/nitrite transporter family protein [Chloroflexota bacterium]